MPVPIKTSKYYQDVYTKKWDKFYANVKELEKKCEDQLFKELSKEKDKVPLTITANKQPEKKQDEKKPKEKKLDSTNSKEERKMTITSN